MTPYEKRMQASEKLKQEIRRLYGTGRFNKSEIARKVQVTKAYVGQVLKEGK